MNNLPKYPILSLLNIGFSELNANWNWKNVQSPFARIYYVVKGHAQTYIKQKRYLLKPGNLYLIPPFTLHDDECDSPFSLFYIHFYEEIFNKESIFEQFSYPIEIGAGELDILLIKRLYEINPNRQLKNIDPQMYDNTPGFKESQAANRKIPTYMAVESQGILSFLISRFMRGATLKSKYKDIRVYKCLQYIHENIRNTISLNQLADISCTSEDHLTRLFKNQTQYTPVKYINLKKLERAQLLLLTTDMPIHEIAMELSFDNVSYFNRLFKNQTNMTPGKYRIVFRQQRNQGEG